MRYLYLDSSVIVSIAVGDPKRARYALKEIDNFDETLTSELASVECQSGISRLCKEDRMGLVHAEQNLNQILARLTLIQVGSPILEQARRLVKSYRNIIGLRTLDGIHVATANDVRQQLSGGRPLSFEFLTADRRQYEAFTAEGYLGQLQE